MVIARDIHYTKLEGRIGKRRRKTRCLALLAANSADVSSASPSDSSSSLVLFQGVPWQRWPSFGGLALKLCSGTLML